MAEFSRPETKYVQINAGGVKNAAPEDFPPVTERVTQHPDPYKQDFADYEVLRTTVQWRDGCNLRCGGCYAKPYLPHGKDLNIIDNSRSATPFDNFTEQISAHGDALQEVYFLGLEPTLVPQETKRMMTYIHSLGMTSVAATNGACSPERFDETFADGLETGHLHRINISLDSFDKDIHNRLRGRKYAYDHTINIIKHAIENEVPFQVTTTVWADNYHTIENTVKELYSLGVRGFVFHEGSFEGAPDFKETPARRVTPMAWRALCAKLEVLKQEYSQKGDLQHFVFPYIYFTEQELRNGIIGDEELTNQYLQHVDKLKAGKDSSLPFVACPAVDVPQVYLFGNDGPESAGGISLCNMHTIQTGTYLATFNGEEKRFLPVQDVSKNQMQAMIDSPHLCPAQPGVMRDGNTTDEFETPDGNLYHACRYISSNQFPAADKAFGSGHYSEIANYHNNRWSIIAENPEMLATIDQIEESHDTYSARNAEVMALYKHIKNKLTKNP